MALMYEDKELKIKALHKLRKKCSFGMNEQGEILEFHSELGETLPTEQEVQSVIEDIQFEETEKEAKQVLDKKFETILEAVTSQYHNYERETWHKQEAEAKAYVNDSNMSTPFIDKLAAKKGITTDELVSKILNKVEEYEFIVTEAIDFKDRYISRIENASSVIELQSIIAEMQQTNDSNG